MIEIKKQMLCIKEDGLVAAYVMFPKISDNVVNINHTFTHVDKRGKGLAKQLLDALYNHLKENNLKAQASCSYAVQYFEKNEDKRDVLFVEEKVND